MLGEFKFCPVFRQFTGTGAPREIDEHSGVRLTMRARLVTISESDRSKEKRDCQLWERLASFTTGIFQVFF